MTETEDTRGEDLAAWKQSFRHTLANAPFENLPTEAYDSAVDGVRDLTEEEADDDRLVPAGYFLQPRKVCSNSLVKAMRGGK